MKHNDIAERIVLYCKLRHQMSISKRKDKLKRLKKYIRINKLQSRIIPYKQNNLTSLCTDIFCESLSDKRGSTNHKLENNFEDCLLQVQARKRSLAVEHIARRQLINTKNSVLIILKKRFFVYKRNFKLDKSVPWVKDLPLKPNYKDSIYFDAKVLLLNKKHLFDVYYRTFKTLFRDFEILDAHAYCFKVARCLNELAYCINNIDNGEFNALNFLFKIYRKQHFDFQSMIQEIASDDALPSPDSAVLHDNVLAVFPRINYFDYNDLTGEIKSCIDNALFILRPELYPFLVTEYLLLRFLLKNVPVNVRQKVIDSLECKYVQNTVAHNVCQLYPGTFTLLFILYFEGNNSFDPNGVLERLVDTRISAQSGDYAKVTSHLKQINTVLCETIYKFEQGTLHISDVFRNKILLNWGFVSYNYLIDVPSISQLPFLVSD